MSIASISALAAERDLRVPQRSAPTTPAGDLEATQTTKLDVFTSVIPTEIVALYTALMAALVTAASVTNDYLEARWIIYASGVVLTPAIIAMTYYARRSASKRRKYPGTEMVAATLAFATWGLIVPESPLVASIATLEEFWIIAITGVGGILVGLFTPSLQQPAKRAKPA